MLKRKLKELLAFAQTTDLQEVVWEKKGVLIHFQRTPEAVRTKRGSRPNAQSAFGSETSSGASHSAPEPVTIRSTMVGTFFRSDSADRPPFVVEGTNVTAGQPVAAIEAMKIMKDVLAPVACKIVKALVANGQPVEYGQPLFQVEPERESV